MDDCLAEIAVWNLKVRDEPRAAGHPDKILAEFSCRVGPFVVHGAVLVFRDHGSMQVWMPRCRRAGTQVMLKDCAARKALKDAAKRAYDEVVRQYEPLDEYSHG